MLDCEFMDSQSDAGGVSGAAGVRTIVVGREGPSLDSAKMLRCRVGPMGLFTSAIAVWPLINGPDNKFGCVK